MLEHRSCKNSTYIDLKCLFVAPASLCSRSSRRAPKLGPTLEIYCLPICSLFGFEGLGLRFQLPSGFTFTSVNEPRSRRVACHLHLGQSLQIPYICNPCISLRHALSNIVVVSVGRVPPSSFVHGIPKGCVTSCGSYTGSSQYPKLGVGPPPTNSGILGLGILYEPWSLLEGGC